MKKACIFDLDGTLLNTLNSIAYFVNLTIGKYGISSFEAEDFKTLTGDGARTLIERVLQKRGKENIAEKETILKEYNEAYDSNPLYLCKPYEGIFPLLENLKSRGIVLNVLTNKPHSTAEKAVNSIFGNKTFSAVLGQREGVPVKPDPAGALEIIKNSGIPAGNFVYVGDTATDVLTGKRAGLFTVGVLWGFREREELEKAGADTIISKPQELEKFFD